MIKITETARISMEKDARAGFPNECCGFMLGNEDQQGNRIITDILIVNNAKEGDKRRRFVISGTDYLEAEAYSEKSGLAMLGIYHSHPGHPAIPSEHDRVAAQPFFSYLILSITDRRIDAIRSWRLNDESQFEEEEVKSFQLI
jgi:proteasome lid subunit RPN8/RPN11